LATTGARARLIAFDKKAGSAVCRWRLRQRDAEQRDELALAHSITSSAKAEQRRRQALRPLSRQLCVLGRSGTKSP